jgi:hypothetical protein
MCCVDKLQFSVLEVNMRCFYDGHSLVLMIL